MQVLVARVGKAHGLRGEVTVRLHTDAPQVRFAPGTVLTAEPPAHGPLTVSHARLHNGVWLVTFEQASDRTAAEALRGTRLFADIEDEELQDEGWYESDLVGLAVLDPTGARIGVVTSLEVRPAQDLLGVRLDDGRTGLVPFVEALVPEVDVSAGHVVVDAPEGLFDLLESDGSGGSGEPE